MKSTCKIIPLILLALAWTVPAQGASCTLSTSGVSFGTYDPLAAGNLDTIGTITVTCSANAGLVTITIGASPNSGGFNPRSMKLASGTTLLNYNLYTTATRDQIWGDGTQGTSTLGQAVKNGTWAPSVYGRIPGGQDIGVGSYSENVTVTITY